MLRGEKDDLRARAFGTELPGRARARSRSRPSRAGISRAADRMEPEEASMRRGRIAVIGGAGRAIGLAIAAALAERPAPQGHEVNIREPAPLPPQPYLKREPPAKDWKQRDRQRPRRR